VVEEDLAGATGRAASGVIRQVAIALAEGGGRHVDVVRAVGAELHRRFVQAVTDVGGLRFPAVDPGARYHITRTSLSPSTGRAPDWSTMRNLKVVVEPAATSRLGNR